MTARKRNVNVKVYAAGSFPGLEEIVARATHYAPDGGLVTVGARGSGAWVCSGAFRWSATAPSPELQSVRLLAMIPAGGPQL